MTINLFQTPLFYVFIAVFAIAIFTIISKVISGLVCSVSGKRQKNHQPKRTRNHGFARHYNYNDHGFMQRTETMNDFVRQENERQFNSFMNQSIADSNSFNDSMNHQMDTMNTINDMNMMNMMNMNGFM